MRFTRRNMISLLAALPMGSTRTVQAQGIESLRSHAVKHHRVYGCSVDSRLLRSDPDLSHLVSQEAGILVAESETKRRAIQPLPGTFDFSGTDFIANFAKINGQLMRGHTLVWDRANPQWLTDTLLASRDEKLLTDYIAIVVGRYNGQFHSWDVVNEAIEPDDGQPDGLKTKSIWYQAFGPSYIELAFRAARASDPYTPLFYNETNIEGDARWCERRRRSTLILLEGLLKKGVPLDGLGIQGHLKCYRVPFSETRFSQFLDEVSAMGLKILITEFDIADIGGPSDAAKRDADVAQLAGRFLDVAFANKAVTGCLTWGISDKYSWLSQEPNYKWRDGQVSRGLPYDANMRPKPLRAAMAAAFDQGV